jgi:hypothetical protein
VDATTGTAYIPVPGDVRHGTNIDATTGTCYVPTAAQTLYGVNVDATTGTVTLPNTDGSTPNAALVLNTAHFGAANATAGTYTPGTIPAASDVRYGVAAGSTTGTCYVPSAANVLGGVNVDATTGTLTLPGAGYVSTAAGAWGVGGSGSTGTRTDCPANAALSGTTYGAGGTSITGTMAVPTAAQIAAAILVTPSNKLATDGSGRVDLVSAPNATAIAAIQNGLAPASTALSTTYWTNARAGYLDNINTSGPVATHADIADNTMLAAVYNWLPANTPVVDSNGKVTFNNTAIGTVTTLTNLPAITSGWLTAAGIAAGALDGKGDWLAASGYTAPDNTTIGDIYSVVGSDLYGNAAIKNAVGSPQQAGTKYAVSWSWSDVSGPQPSFVASNTSLGATAPAGWVNQAAFAAGVLPANFGSLVLTEGQAIAASGSTAPTVAQIAAALLSDPATPIQVDAQGFVRFFYSPQPQIVYTMPANLACSRADVESVFGATNVQKWADVDNCGDPTVIARRIDWSIAWATNELQDMLRDGPYVVDPLPVTAAATWVPLAAMLAGWMLSNPRVGEDTVDSAVQRKNSWALKHVQETVHEIKTGLRRINAMPARRMANVPMVMP